MRIDDVSLPDEISRFQYIDYFKNNWQRGLAASLARAVSDAGELVPPGLQVASAPADEGGVTEGNLEESNERYEAKIAWPLYQMPGDYWRYVNGIIASTSLGQLYEFRRHIADWDRLELSSLEVHLSEFFRRDQLVSLVIGRYEYFSGTPHPSHGVKTINIFGEYSGVLSIEELFGRSLGALDYIGEYTELDLKRRYGGKDYLNISSYHREYLWNLYSEYSFNSVGIRLNLSSHSGLPHVFGYHDVYIPWENLREFLAPVPRKILIAFTDRD